MVNLKETTNPTAVQVTKTRRGSLSKILEAIATLFGVILCLSILFGFLGITIVNGISMNPTYKTGDVVVSVKQAEYKTGQVIVYHPKDLPCDKCNVVHRIVSGNATTGWTTQGDNNPNIDEWRPKADEIKGEVILHIPLGKISVLIFSPSLWLFVLSIIGMIFIISYLKQPTQEDPETKD